MFNLFDQPHLNGRIKHSFRFTYYVWGTVCTIHGQTVTYSFLLPAPMEQ
ncbi:hypothetical protein M132_1095 [Bacteroides fragilis str. S24L15]|nr:hypothetical protein M132_1095 [Bacteroides fragilis str. S24L15]EYA74154.1 hypothetical protein M133_3688 [Bacteroides fragilis str. S24L26]EYA81273.1 hypothetical protein M134_1301 [Bacteroides fragilis str. S24L34]